jgi:hypothetical protein
MTPTASSPPSGSSRRDLIGHAQRRADAEIVNALALGEELVSHRVAGKHALAAVDHVVDDGSRGVDLLAPVLAVGFLAIGLIAGSDDLRDELVGLLVDEQDDSAVGLYVLEDQVHHHLEHLVDVEAAAQSRAELVEDLEVAHGGGGGLGDRQHHRVLVGRHGVHDGGVHARLFAGEVDVAAMPARHARLSAEDEQRSADANLVAELERVGVEDALAVDVRAVGAAEVLEDPVAVVRHEFAVSAAHRVVGERQLPAVAAYESGRVRELEASPLVGALENEKREHAIG